MPIKHLNASVGVQIIGSPRTLTEVLTTSGQPVLSFNLEIIAFDAGTFMDTSAVHAEICYPTFDMVTKCSASF